MNPLELQPLIRFDESDASGTAEPETTDFSDVDDETLDATYDAVFTDKPDETDTPTVIEPVEPDTSTPSEPAPADTLPQEPVTTDKPEEPTEPGKLLLGKYKSVEDLEKAHEESVRKMTEVATESADRQRQLDELNQKISGLTAPPEKDTEPDTLKAPFDSDKFNEIYLGEGMDKAVLYALTAVEDGKQEQVRTTKVESLKEEAGKFNQSLGLQYARNLYYEKAKESGDQKLMDRFGNKDHAFTEDDFKLYPETMEAFDRQLQWIDKTFKYTPVLLNDDIVAPQGGRWPEDIFNLSHIALNHTKIVEDTAIKANEDTARAIQDAKPGAKILTSTQDARVEISNVQFDGHEDSFETSEKLKPVSDEDLDATLVEHGLE